MKTIVEWTWEEAFDKFGFDDGDGWNGTHLVVDAIESLGYECDTDSWGCHNYMIFDVREKGYSAKYQGKSVSTGDDPQIGYDDPRSYLPEDIINHLDKEFADD